MDNELIRDINQNMDLAMRASFQEYILMYGNITDKQMKVMMTGFQMGFIKGALYGVIKGRELADTCNKSDHV